MKGDLDQVLCKGIKDSILRVQIDAVLDQLVILMDDCMLRNTLLEPLSPDAFLKLPDSIEPLALCALVSKMQAIDAQVKSVRQDAVDSHFDLMFDLAQWAQLKHKTAENMRPVLAPYEASPDKLRHLKQITEENEARWVEAIEKFHVAEQRYHSAYEDRFISILNALSHLFQMLAPTGSVDSYLLTLFQSMYQNLSPQKKMVLQVFFHQDAYAYIEHVKSLVPSSGDHAVLRPWNWLREFVLSRAQDQGPLSLKQTSVAPSSEWGWIDHVDDLRARCQSQTVVPIQRVRSMFSIGSEVIFGLCFLVGCAVVSILEWQALPIFSIMCGVMGLIGAVGFGVHLWGAHQEDPLITKIYDAYCGTVNTDQMLSGSALLPPKQLCAEISRQLAAEPLKHSIRAKVSV